jgi:methionyl-tRNA synthetase
MAAGLEVPKQVYVHGYLLMGEHKMSKSLGNVIDPFEVIEKYSVDALRYYLLASVGFGQDGSVSPEDFETRYDAELANQYGNLASRTLAMIARYRDGVVPDAQPAPEVADFANVGDEVAERFDAVQPTQALGLIWALVRQLNQFVQDKEPWQLAKDESAAEELDSVLYTLAEGLRVVSVLVHPFMPDSAERLLAALGQESLSLAGARIGAVGGGATVEKLPPLFPRVESAPAAA